ncbi:hypothetical protein [Streptomyces flavofungini]|uniref:hypothetical protein n=1 Tax=Streptomyces flavofungini TaxID=68200 RepID=UPI0025AF0AE0|nr:hypothetical protein [Streptomyces flavofungini]WJV44700.1 hypothetical protein QUY26_03650 [Streptomyces flavofungini]
MSGSPKYSSVRVGALYAQREAAERRRRAEERRARERKRAAQRAQLAARRADLARRDAELATRREAEREARRAAARAEQSRADERGLDGVRQLVEEAQRSGARADAGALEGELAELRGRVARGEHLGDAVERLRGRVVSLRPAATGGAADDPAAVLAELERGLAATGPEGAALDADGHRRCRELLDQLRATAGPDRRVRFDALLGTVEHALARHAATVAESRSSAERNARAEREREARQQEQEREREAAEREREAAAAAALERTLAEAAERLDVVRSAAQGVLETAAELGDPGLADEIGDALRAAAGALTARSAAEALTAVAALEDRLPDAERRLDELELAYQRSRDLVAALRDAMTDEGFAFEGGEDEGGSFRLHFTRPTGATYETTVGVEDDGTPVLVYRVQGEPDVTLHASRDEAVCDTTEALLERVHEALGGDDGFVPGEITWDGKPPGRRAKPLPRGASWRWTAP